MLHRPAVIPKIYPKAQDFLPLLGTDYVEFFVGNCLQAAHFYQSWVSALSLCRTQNRTQRSGKLCVESRENPNRSELSLT